jgi:tRNA(Ile)-lysidine synthase
VVVGLSGGGDSVALTLLLGELSKHGGFTVVGLAHFNHRLRTGADADEAFCRDLGARLNLPVRVEACDVASYASSNRLSVENAARRLRYGFLHRVAADMSANRIAVGHTEDDQAETFLLKLGRGAGLSGLGGIYPQRGEVVRPLLEVSRAALREYLTARGQAWVEDDTNAALDHPRNRVRHRVVPELAQAVGPGAVPAIGRAAMLAREDGTWLDQLAARRFAELVRRCGEGLECSAAALSAEPPPLRRRVLLMAMRAVAGGREVGADHVAAGLDLLAGLASAADIPGSRMELRAGKLVLFDQRVVAK